MEDNQIWVKISEDDSYLVEILIDVPLKIWNYKEDRTLKITKKRDENNRSDNSGVGEDV